MWGERPLAADGRALEWELLRIWIAPKVWPWALALVMFLASFLLDPFGLGGYTATRSQALVNVIFPDQLAPPLPTEANGLPISNAVVVLIGDEDVAELTGWAGTTLELITSLLDAVLGYEPKGVLIDFMFIAERAADDQDVQDFTWVLADFAVRVREPAPPPILIARAPPLRGFCDGIRPVLLQARDGQEPFDHLVQLVAANASTETERENRYALASPICPLPNTGCGGPDISLLPAPALAAYQRLSCDAIVDGAEDWLCRPVERLAAASCPGAGRQQPLWRWPDWLGPHRDDGPAPVMDVMWPARPARANLGLAQCTEADLADREKLVSRIWRASIGGLRRTRSDNCIHVPAVPALALMSADPAVTTPLANLIRDKFVMIGEGLTGSSDLVRTPISGTLPGVFLHAAALDNLMGFEGRYRSEAPRLAALCLAVTLLLVVWLFEHYRHRQPSLRALAGIGCLGVAGLAVLIADGFGRMPPWNSGGWVLLALTLGCIAAIGSALVSDPDVHGHVLGALAYFGYLTIWLAALALASLIWLEWLHAAPPDVIQLALGGLIMRKIMRNLTDTATRSRQAENVKE